MDDKPQDVRGLFPLMATSRRGFVVTTLATGLALAVPEARAMIVTDTHGLTAGTVQIPVADGRIPAYRAMPDRGGPFPILLVVEEVFGVHAHIQDMCRRFAKQGYLAVAPELYARLGDVVHMTDMDEVMATVNQLADTQAFSDLDATLAWAAANGGDGGRAGITGFCRGGRMVWMYAAHNPRLKAAVAWYGPVANPPSGPMPENPIDVAPHLTVPVLGLYGAEDQGIPVVSVEHMRALLDQGGSGSKIVIYPDAGHGFNADYRPSYVAADAADGMKRALAWLKGHGVG